MFGLERVQSSILLSELLCLIKRDQRRNSSHQHLREDVNTFTFPSWEDVVYVLLLSRNSSRVPSYISEKMFTHLHFLCEKTLFMFSHSHLHFLREKMLFMLSHLHFLQEKMLYNTNSNHIWDIWLERGSVEVENQVYLTGGIYLFYSSPKLMDSAAGWWMSSLYLFEHITWDVLG